MSGITFYNEGMKQLNEGKFNEALALFNKALDLQPDHPDYLSDRAVTYFHLDKKDLAMIDLNRAQSLDPLNPYRYSSRAFVKDSLGDLEGAIKDYEKAIELDPEDAVAYNNLGLLEEKLGYRNKAQQRYKRADELMGDQTENKGKEFIPMMEMKENTSEDKTKENLPESKSSWKHVKYAVFTKAGRKEFFSFLRNGFKIKK